MPVSLSTFETQESGETSPAIDAAQKLDINGPTYQLAFDSSYRKLKICIKIRAKHILEKRPTVWFI